MAAFTATCLEPCRFEDNRDCALYRTKLKLTLDSLDQERKVALGDWAHSSTLVKRQVSM